MRLIFATNNKYKMSEIIDILGEKYKDIIFIMSDLGININPDETGKTFYENAYIKSKALYDEMKEKRMLKQGDFLIADDTGLCIDYLDNAPGIYSARFLGENTKQSDKNDKILELMKDVADSERKAYFVTVLAVIEVVDVSTYETLSHTFEAKVDGYIAKSIEKTEGFGYDPIFAVGDPKDIENGTVKTYSNLGISEKNKISHRAKALHKFVLYLEKEHNI